MNRSLYTWLVAAILVGGVGFLIYSFRQSQSIAHELEQARAQAVATQQGLAALRENIAEAGRKRAAAAAQVAALQASRAASVAATDVKRAGPSQPTEASLLQKNPELRELAAKAFRAGLAQRYGLINARLGLSPDKIEKLNDLFTVENTEQNELLAAAAAEGVGRNDPAVQSLVEELQAKYWTSTAGIIGKDAAEQYKDFVRLTPVVGVVNDAAGYLALGPNAMTPEQEFQLVQIVGNSTVPNPVNGRADPATIDWPTVLRQAEGVLSPAQLAIFKTESQLYSVGKASNQFYQARR